MKTILCKKNKKKRHIHPYFLISLLVHAAFFLMMLHLTFQQPMTQKSKHKIEPVVLLQDMALPKRVQKQSLGATKSPQQQQPLAQNQQPPLQKTFSPPKKPIPTPELSVKKKQPTKPKLQRKDLKALALRNLLKKQQQKPIMPNKNLITATQDMLSSPGRLDGNDILTTFGPTTNTPSPIALKYLSFARNTLNEIFTSFHQRKHQLDWMRLRGEADFHVLINKYGKIQRMETVHSSGNHYIETVSRNILKQASPLAPIPQSLHKNDLIIAINFRWHRAGISIGIRVI